PDRPVDVAVAPQATADVPAVEPLPMREAEAPSAKAMGITVESRAEPPVKTESIQPAGHLDIKPSSGEAQVIADREPAPRPPSNDAKLQVESRAETAVQTESLPSTGYLDIKPTESSIEEKPQQTFTERGRRSFAARQDASTCFHSASAVRQNSAGAWPAW